MTAARPVVPALGAGVAAAYTAAAPAWQRGPGIVYDRLADVALDRCPVPLDGATVLDIGAGTGAATRAAIRRGSTVVAVDAAIGMVAWRAPTRPPAAVGDAAALPFATATFDAVVAAFCLNHLADPVPALSDAARVLRPGGGLVVTSYAAEDRHPVKEAVDAAAADLGWVPDVWHREVRDRATPRLSTIERAASAATAAGLAGAAVELVQVPFPELGPEQLVDWRLGMAQLAPFVAGLRVRDRGELRANALARLGSHPPPLVRSMIVLTARTSE